MSTDLSNLETAHPDLKVQTLNVYSLMNQAVANPSSYGFTDVADPSMWLSSADGYLFWDYVHPTAAGHAVLANAAALTIPEPGALALLMIGVGTWVAATACRRRGQPSASSSGL